MELMARYPDKYFDLAIVDPEYGIGADKKNAHSSIRDNSKYGEKNWDSKIPSKEYFNELSIIEKDNEFDAGSKFEITSLNEIQKRLGFEDLLCTRHNKKTGAIIGKNCRDEEKVKRLFELYNNEDIKIIDVYSDSLKHDKPIFSLGENCYHIVKGNKIPFKFKDIYGW